MRWLGYLSPDTFEEYCGHFTLCFAGVSILAFVLSALGSDALLVAWKWPAVIWTIVAGVAWAVAWRYRTPVQENPWKDKQ